MTVMIKSINMILNDTTWLADETWTSLAQDWGKINEATHICLAIFSISTARCIYMYDFLLNEGPRVFWWVSMLNVWHGCSYLLLTRLNAKQFCCPITGVVHWWLKAAVKPGSFHQSYSLVKVEHWPPPSVSLIHLKSYRNCWGYFINPFPLF